MSASATDNYKSKASKIAIFSLLIILAFIYYERNKNYSVDDSFITYRYAFHLLQGHGLRFNIDEKYYGTTAAGYAVLLSAANALADALSSKLTTQNVSVALSALALFIISFVAYLIAESRKLGRTQTLILTAALSCVLFSSTAFNEVAGHETYAFLGGALLGTFLASRNRMFSSGVVIAITTTFRPDAVLFAPIICCTYIYTRSISIRHILHERRLYLFGGGFLLVLLPWLAFVQSYFGRPFPGTMDAKRAQILMGYWPSYNLENLTKYVTGNLDLATSSILITGCLCFILKLLLSFKNKELELTSGAATFTGICWLVFMLASVTFYLSINVTFWHWYGIPVVFSLAVITYSGLVSILPAEGNAFNAKSFVAVTPALICCILLLSNNEKFAYWAKSKNTNPHITAYFETADYLKSIEPNGTIIEMAEPGSFGMRLGSKFKIVDELGLVTPNVAKAYLLGDENYANREYHAKYIVCSWVGSYSACANPNIMDKYTLIGEFDKEFWTPFLGHGARLYKKN